MQVQVFMNSARDLKNVNWRNGLLKPYAIVWIDSSGRCSTKADLDNGVNPVWKEKFTIPLPSTSYPETAVLHIDVVHAIPSPNTKPLIGLVKLPLNEVLIEARANGKVARSLELKRPSGRPQGMIEIKIGVKDQNILLRDQELQPHLNNRPMQPRIEPQPQVQPRPQVQSQPQRQLQARFQPQAQPRFRPQSQPQFQPSQRPTTPLYSPGYRPVGPSTVQHICNLGLNMAFGRRPAHQILRHMAPTNNLNVMQANNNVALPNAGDYPYPDGQHSDGGYGGYGFDVGGGFDNGSGLDMGGIDYGSGTGMSDMGDGSGIEVSGLDNGSVPDLSEMGGGGFDFGGLMGGLMGD